MKLELLPGIHSPKDIKSFSVNELEQLAEEVRAYTVSVITKTGGHLASTLGVVDLTIALHYLYDTPNDKIIWDVGHQAYAHKILTGRFKDLPSIRQYKGISGFLKRNESEYDVFGAGHASTSISAGLGIAAARDYLGEKYKVVCVIGDGSMTGGLAYEGLNNAGHLRKQLLVILNDNNMSISPNVGAMRTYLTRLVTNPLYNRIRDDIWGLTRSLPFGKSVTRRFIKKVEESLKNLIVPGILFDEMGFRYFGPVNGHDLKEMIQTLRNIKEVKSPVLLHVLTKKGKGLRLAEEDPISFHGVKGSNDIIIKPKNSQGVDLGFTEVFGKLVCEVASQRTDTICITPAMREGSGLVEYEKQYPDRYFDVGIAEGHAVTFSAGLATQKIKPICVIYSTFLQRAYDHIIHDAALQNLPLVLCLDRAGLVGEDGPTHHGTFDIVYLRSIPNMVVTAPKDGNEFRNLLYTALNQNKKTFSIRYPKASALHFNENGQADMLPLGTWEIMKPGKDIAILAIGPQVYDCLEAARELEKKNISCQVVNCRFIKPMDEAYLEKLLKNFVRVITFEEGTLVGGFGEGIASWLLTRGFKGQIKQLGIPDKFIEHGSRSILIKNLGLDKAGIIKQAHLIMKST